MTAACAGCCRWVRQAGLGKLAERMTKHRAHASNQTLRVDAAAVKNITPTACCNCFLPPTRCSSTTTQKTGGLVQDRQQLLPGPTWPISVILTRFASSRVL
jgi:hypothetical protein